MSADATPPERTLIERVEVGAYYTDGESLWRVTEVNPLGSVTLYGGTPVERYRNVGIDAFRREMWRAR